MYYADTLFGTFLLKVAIRMLPVYFSLKFVKWYILKSLVGGKVATSEQRNTNGPSCLGQKRSRLRIIQSMTIDSLF
jgi:hypothetical protein